MERRWSSMVVGSLVAAIVTAGCGGGSSNPKTSASARATTTSAEASPGSPSTTPAKALPAACTLPTSAQVAAVLGAAPKDPGSEQDYSPTYKTCSWNVVPPGAANSNAIRLGVVDKTNPTDKGFGAPSQVPNASPVSGLGDEATLYTKSGAFSEVVLVANKGAFSVSIDANYGGQGPGPDGAKTALVEVVRQVFTAVGA